MSKRYYDGTLISSIYHPNNGIAYHSRGAEIDKTRVNSSIFELRNVQSNIYDLFPNLQHAEIKHSRVDLSMLKNLRHLRSISIDMNHFTTTNYNGTLNNIEYIELHGSLRSQQLSPLFPNAVISTIDEISDKCYSNMNTSRYVRYYKDSIVLKKSSHKHRRWTLPVELRKSHYANTIHINGWRCVYLRVISYDATIYVDDTDELHLNTLRDVRLNIVTKSVLNKLVLNGVSANLSQCHVNNLVLKNNCRINDKPRGLMIFNEC
jgi:hypothetical protein